MQLFSRLSGNRAPRDIEKLRAELGALRQERDGYKNAYETLNAEIGQLRMKLESGRPPQLEPATNGVYTPVFHYDGLWTDPAIIHNHDFMRDERYISALRAGEKALEHDHKMFWRLHVALWCAQRAATLAGDFVECGVWRGFLSIAIMTYLDWPSAQQRFFLFDTFDGMVEELLTKDEIANSTKIAHLNQHYRNEYERAKQTFSKFKRVTIVKGAVPETLASADMDAVSFLSLDMNCVNPEIAAAEYFWPKMPRGGIVLLDDYGFVSYEEQKRAFDAFADRKSTKVMALPTGQGLLMKP
jgi:hypothetical protein